MNVDTWKHYFGFSFCRFEHLPIAEIVQTFKEYDKDKEN